MHLFDNLKEKIVSYKIKEGGVILVDFREGGCISLFFNIKTKQLY